MNNMEDDENTSPSSDLQLHELQVPVQPQGSHKLSKEILLSDANIPSEVNPNIDDHISDLFVPSANEPSNFAQVCTENDVILCRDVASSGLAHAGMDCDASRKIKLSNCRLIGHTHQSYPGLAPHSSPRAHVASPTPTKKPSTHGQDMEVVGPSLSPKDATSSQVNRMEQLANANIVQLDELGDWKIVKRRKRGNHKTKKEHAPFPSHTVQRITFSTSKEQQLEDTSHSILNLRKQHPMATMGSVAKDFM